MNAIRKISSVLIYMPSVRQSKEEVIHAVTNRTSYYYTTGHEQIHLLAVDEHASMIGKSGYSQPLFGDGPHTLLCRCGNSYHNKYNIFMF